MKYQAKLTFAPMLLAPAAMAALIAVPAAAQDGTKSGPYVGVSGGIALPQDSNNTGTINTAIPETDDFGSIPADTPIGWETDFDTGFTLSGQAGYAFENGFRVEAEAAYSKYDVDDHQDLSVGGAIIDGVDSAVLTRGPASVDNPTVDDILSDGQGEVSTFGLFGNVFYDIETGSSLKPFVGAGFGYQWVDVEYQPSGVAFGEDSDSVFAYQFMAGASYDLSQGVEVFGQYTYRDTTEDVDIPLTILPATLDVSAKQSLVTAGVRVRFGG